MIVLNERGFEFGSYQAATPEQAAVSMLRDAGYVAWVDTRGVIVSDECAAGTLVVRPAQDVEAQIVTVTAEDHYEA